MSEVLVSVFARTDIGMQRAGNEDAFLVADLSTGNVGLGPEMSTHRVGEQGSLLVVSDGMGGAVAGEIASELAVTTIRDELMNLGEDRDVPHRLVQASEAANRRIWDQSQDRPEFSGMGATLTAVLVQDASAYIAQVGDSRAYMIRDQRIKQLTKDQSLAQMLLDSGVIEPEQFESVPQNVIMQALGTQPTVKVALSAVSLCKNDCLVLCSDGLSNKIKPDELNEIIRASENLSTACKSLVDLANERGGEDNITVIIAQFDGEALHAASESSITGSFLAISEDYFNKSDYVSQAVDGQDTESSPIGVETNALSDPTPTPTERPVFDMPEHGATRPLSSADQPLFTQPLTTGAGVGSQTQSLDDSGDEPARDETLPLTPGVAGSFVEPATESIEVEHVPEPAGQTRSAPRKSFALVWIVALLSLLLLAAMAYFVYFYYLEPSRQQNGPIIADSRAESGKA